MVAICLTILQVIRAVYKEMNPGGDYYYKGKGKEFEDWRLKNFPSSMWMRLERAGGGRQDLAFDGALPIFVDRKILATFLSQLVFLPGHSNILETYLWTVLSCTELVALLRALTIFDLVLSRPLRWLAGSSSKLNNWSIFSMGLVLLVLVLIISW